MASLDLTSADAFLKQYYHVNRIRDTTYTNHPTLAMLNKDESFPGRNMPLVLQYGMPQGRSASFSKAQLNTTAAKFEDFLLTRRRDYSVATIDGETAEATESDAGAFAKALTVQVDGALKSLADSLSSSIFRSGTGSIGQVGSISTNVLTLKAPSDIVNFEVGMTLRVSPTDGAAERAGTEVVAKVNRNLGTITSTSATWATNITAIAANDYLLVDGDLNAKITGFEAWILASAPTPGESFYGVDRSIDSRLYGQFYDMTANGDSIDEGFINADSAATTEGGMIDTIITNPRNFRDLKKILQSRSTYERCNAQARGPNGTIGTISFAGIVIDGDNGPIKVISDPRCQGDTSWGLTSDSVALYSIGPAGKILMKDGLRIMRQPTSDGYEVRTGMYGNLGFNAPSFNIRIKHR